MLLFSTPSCELAPFCLLTGSPSPFSPFPVWNKYHTGVFIHTLCTGNKGGGGGDRGPQTDKHLPPSTFIGKFLEKLTFWVWCLHRFWSLLVPISGMFSLCSELRQWAVLRTRYAALSSASQRHLSPWYSFVSEILTASVLMGILQHGEIFLFWCIFIV